MSIFDIFKKKDSVQKKDSASEENSTCLEAAVLSVAKNEILMQVTEEGNASADGSKIGGKPWLPSDFAWPTFTDREEKTTRPLSFLCQINLADVRGYDRDRLLPERGMLYFFYECESFRWGFDPEDKGCARVFYFENTDGFAPMEWPEGIGEEYVVPEMAVCFTARRSYPKYEELAFHSHVDCDWEAYDTLLEKLGADTEAEDHKLLGYADIIQDEMLSECERVSRGLFCGDPESYRGISEDEEASIQRGARDWTLLLQLSTLEKGDWELMWGDCGMLYFYVKKQDLAAKNFENAWFALQCG